MAFVGTSRNLGDARTTLASTLQGEAGGNQAGQIAVGNVLMNRAAVNFGGFGGDAVSQATGRLQFQGQVPVGQITPQSYANADAILSGTLPRTLPNSLNYAAPVFSGPGATTARWAINALNSGQGVNVGGNVFFVNDRGGTPSYNPGAAPGGVGTSSDGTTAKAGTITTDAGDGTILSQKGDADHAEVVLGGSNPSDEGTGAGVGNSGTAAAGGSGTATQAGSGQQSPNGATSGSGQSQSAGSGSGGSGFGAYMNEIARAIASQLSPSTEKAGQTVASATEKSGTTIAKGSTDAATIAATQSKATNTLFSDLTKDYFGRGVVVVLGIVFVAGGVAMFVYSANPIALAKKALT